jgi:hypothetical protein
MEHRHILKLHRYTFRTKRAVNEMGREYRQGTPCDSPTPARPAHLGQPDGFHGPEPMHSVVGVSEM